MWNVLVCDDTWYGCVLSVFAEALVLHLARTTWKSAPPRTVIELNHLGCTEVFSNFSELLFLCIGEVKFPLTIRNSLPQRAQALTPNR